jgi:hypothetical protein
MNRRLDLLGLACGMALAVVAAGCQTRAPSTRKPGDVVDPCADRLHGICGRLLLYHSLNGKLPADVADLKTVDSAPMPPLSCPASGRPYVYNREGLPVSGRSGRLVLYDAAPTHSGMRWGILADAAVEKPPLTAGVILLSERPVFSGSKPSPGPGQP